MSDFYVTLQKGELDKSYVFRYRLPHAIDLENNYVVGISEVSFEQEHLTLIKHETITLSDKDSGEIIHADIIPPGYYKTPQELISALSNLALSTYLSISLEPVFKRVVVGIKLKNTLLSIPRYLAILLGWVDLSEPFLTITVSAISPSAVDPARLLSKFLYIYCDIVYPSIVGDIYSTLLRIVPTNAETITFNPVQYVKVSKTHFDTVSFHIKSETGSNVRLVADSVPRFTVHFKRLL